MLDELDLKILELLKFNAKVPLKIIGEEVHLTPQAVSNRIIRLQNTGIITRYTICTNNLLLGRDINAFLTIFMKTNNHSGFIRLVNSCSIIEECHRISGEGCYMLKVTCSSMNELNLLIDSILEYGNYKLNLSTSAIKK